MDYLQIFKSLPAGEQTLIKAVELERRRWRDISRELESSPRPVVELEWGGDMSPLCYYIQRVKGYSLGCRHECPAADCCRTGMEAFATLANFVVKSDLAHRYNEPMAVMADLIVDDLVKVQQQLVKEESKCQL